ncbi:hypothetical protein [Uliginosibacterium gangwonense]|uniref:hypothetical protein n=1 Tax=Uliginosibacterium gangwonense TaxID=392736 RepID=UPI00036ACD20|nr:hypothetical protein [Uliginosibacterium gangwonense]
MLNNIPEAVLHDMDNLLETRDKDSSGERLTAINDFLSNAENFCARQRNIVSDPSKQHEYSVLSRGFLAAKLIVQQATNPSV